MLKVAGRSVTGLHAARADIERWAWRLAPLATALLSLALGLVVLGRRSFSPDEAQSADLAGRSVGQLGHLLRLGDVPQAAFTALIKPWALLVGMDEWWLRLPSVAFAATAVAVTYLLSLRLFGRWTALVASLALATSVFVVTSSQQSRGATLALLTATVAMYGFVVALARPTSLLWGLYGAAVLLAGAVSLYALAVIAAQLAAYLTVSPRPPVRAPAIAVGAALVGLIPVVVFAHRTAAEQLASAETPTLDTVARGLWQLAGANPLTVVAAVAGGIVLVRGALRGEEPWRVVLLGTWVGAPLLLALVVSVVEPAFVPANLIASTPAIALFAAVGIVAQRQRIAIGVAAALILISGARLVQWYAGSDPADWRAAARYVVRAQQPSEAVLAATETERFAFQYYAGRGFLATEATGPGVWLLISGEEAADRLRIGREIVAAPAFALLAEQPFGADLAVQHWARP